MTLICVDVEKLRSVMRPARNCVHAALLAWRDYFQWDLELEPWVQDLIAVSYHQTLESNRVALESKFVRVVNPELGDLAVKDKVMVALVIDDLRVLRWTKYGIRLNRIPENCLFYRVGHGN